MLDNKNLTESFTDWIWGNFSSATSTATFLLIKRQEGRIVERYVITKSDRNFVSAGPGFPVAITGQYKTGAFITADLVDHLRSFSRNDLRKAEILASIYPIMPNPPLFKLDVGFGLNCPSKIELPNFEFYLGFSKASLFSGSAREKMVGIVGYMRR